MGAFFNPGPPLVLFDTDITLKPDKEGWNATDGYLDNGYGGPACLTGNIGAASGRSQGAYTEDAYQPRLGQEAKETRTLIA